MILPVFPLPIYLLPGGITRLRIFEQRYLKMVRNVNKTNGFVIIYNKGETNEINWGSWVEIIDFNQQDDGVLTIDVKCRSLVDIDSGAMTENSDKLMMAPVKNKEHWGNISTADTSEILTQQLTQFFFHNPSFNDLYKTKHLNDPLWVCRRWLELVPVNIFHKQYFVEGMTFTKAVGFLESLFINND